MHIDLTNPKEFTIENVRKLLASTDDSRNRQLRVTTEGSAFISDEVGIRNLDGIKFRFETWGAGNGYCGSKAAKNEKYVRDTYKDLKTAWEKGLKGYIDVPPECL